MKEGPYDGKFWWLNFTKNSAKVSAHYNESDNQNGGSSHDTGESRDHTYTRINEGETILSYKDIHDDESLRKFLEITNEMRLSDLKKLRENEVESIKNDIGLLWHLRLGHVSRTYLEHASKTIPELKGVKFQNSITDCEVCKKAKMHRLPFKTTRFRYDEPMRLIHTDVMGPIVPPTYKYGACYIVVFIDDCTRYAWAYPMNNKSDVHIAFEKMLANARNIRGNQTRIYKLRLDNGNEYKSEAMKRILTREEIACEEIPPYTPSLNGTAERFMRELQEKVRSLILDSGYPKQMWAYALQFAITVYNKTPKSSINFRIPYELFHKRKCTIKYFKRFGSVCYTYNPLKKDKFDERSKRGFLVACAETGYHFIEPATGVVYKSRHVSFIESKTYGDIYNSENKRTVIKDPIINEKEVGSEWLASDRRDSTNASANDMTSENLCNTLSVYLHEYITKNQKESEPKRIKLDEKLKRTTNEEISEISQVRQIFSLLSEAKIVEDENMFRHKGSSETDIYHVLHYEYDTNVSEPKTFEEAVSCNEAEKWKTAIRTEFDAHKKNKTWVLVKRNDVPKKEPIIDARWLFKIKIENRGQKKFKARLVVRGFADRNYYDISETYAPVSNIADVGFLLAGANKFNLEVHQMDVTTAFLNGELEKKGYMKIPEGLEAESALKNEYVCKLEKALYRLKVSPREWYENFRNEIKKLNFEIYPFQPCIIAWR